MFTLAAPIVVVQLGMMTMGVVDTLMVGRISAEALGAVALGHLYVWAVSVFGIGVLMALDPIVAQAVGARDEPAIARGLQRGLVLSLLLAIPISLAFWPVGPVLRFMRQPAEVVPLAVAYVHASIPGIFPILAFTVLRQTLQAMHRTAPIVVAILLANLVNVVLNWALIFGHFGAPAMGAPGSGWATTVARWSMALSLYWLGHRYLAPHLAHARRDALAIAPLLRMLCIGMPIGVQYVLELGAFGAIALLMGFLGTSEVAAHQIAINLASLTFMVPLGISAAAAVRVGNAVGRADLAAARRATRAAMTLGVLAMVVMATLLLSMPALLARAYTSEPAVVALAVALIPIAGFFQVFDGIQVVAIGVLRGLGDTTAPMLVNILGFWLIGMPVSLWLAFHVDAGPEGLWWGLVAGLIVVAVLLLARVFLRLRGPIGRVEHSARGDGSEAVT